MIGGRGRLVNVYLENTNKRIAFTAGGQYNDKHLDGALERMEETEMNVTDQLNMTMLCDFYELTMGNGYFEAGLQDRITYFDVFFREVPDHGGYAVCAGLDRIIEYILDLHFSEEDIAYLRSKQLFSERFLEYLRNFKFTGDIWAIPEGTPIFPHEPSLPSALRLFRRSLWRRSCC